MNESFKKCTTGVKHALDIINASEFHTSDEPKRDCDSS